MASPDKTWLGLPTPGDDDPSLGRVLGNRYRLLRELGAGQMARVYVAEQIELGRNVAVKLLRDEVALDDIALHRFRQEMRIAATLCSSHTITYFDAGQAEGGAPFLAMELLAGETLRERLEREGTIPPSEAVAIATQVAESLVEAHDAGIVHRDLKPENIFLCRHPSRQRPFAKVLDFGLAKLLHPAPGSPSLTDRYKTVGTPAYMAPEQIVAERAVDHRADVYALGVICFEMLTGTRPFTGATVMDVALGHITRPIPSVVELAPDVPASLDAFFATALAKLAAERFAHATALADALAWVLGR